MTSIRVPHTSRCSSAAFILIGSIFLGGCATVQTGRVHTAASAQLPEIKTAGALPPEITLNQLSAGGVREKRDDWGDGARKNAQAALEQLRPGKIVVLGDAASKPELADEIAEVRALFNAIDTNITLYGSPPLMLPSLAGRFDFSVGSIDHILTESGADALLVISGVDDYFTGDRKALVAVGLVAAAFTGVYIQPGNGAEHISAALIARDGTILWYDSLNHAGIADLRTPEGVKATLERLLKSMPQPFAPKSGS